MDWTWIHLDDLSIRIYSSIYKSFKFQFEAYSRHWVEQVTLEHNVSKKIQPTKHKQKQPVTEFQATSQPRHSSNLA